jgi:hypothetical protein
MSLTYSITPSKENIVANISLYDLVTATTKIPANIDVGLEKPILRKCSDYKVTILRFQCSLTSVQPPYNLNGKSIKIIIRNTTSSNTQSVILNHTVNTIFDFIQVVNSMLFIAHNSVTGDSTQPPYLYFQPENKLFYFVILQKLTLMRPYIPILADSQLLEYLIFKIMKIGF